MMLRLSAVLLTILALSPIARAADPVKPDAPKPPAKEAPKTAPLPGAGPAKGTLDTAGLDVVVKSARVDYIGLKKPLPGGGFEDLISGQKVLVVTLTLTNKGEKDVTYKSFNGSVESKGEDRASLLTTTKKFLPLVNFGDLEPADVLKQATLKPGDSVTDVLCFMAPPAGVVPDTMMLPAKNHGGNGYWNLKIKVEEDGK